MTGKNASVSAYAAVDIPYVAAFTTYLGYAVLIVFGYIRDFCGRGFRACASRLSFSSNLKEPNRAPLLDDFQDFYIRRLYQRIADCWARPIASAPGAWVELAPSAADARTGLCLESCQIPQRHILNLGSYNYLGYGEVEGGVDTAVYDALRDYGVATCGAQLDAGITAVVTDLEREVAAFVRKPDAIVMGMGFATNSQLISAIVHPDDLIISDALNHASIVVGARNSRAKVQIFEHNNMQSLERVLRNAIANGNPDTKNPWNRIFIVIEGMYSMEGETPHLREIVQLKKRYGAYLYVDEAHSIGALGATGRGICEYCGVHPEDVDILMGTFTKSFGAVGGYVASSRTLIQYLRHRSVGALYGSAMSPPCAAHILWTLRQITGLDGSDIGMHKIDQLRNNSIFFREQLAKMHVQTLGDWDSPVIPIMLYNPAKIAAFSRECLDRGLAVVVVGFPATPLLLSRARICISAAHTRDDLVWALSVINEVAEIIQIKYDRPFVRGFLQPAAMTGDCNLK